MICLEEVESTIKRLMIILDNSDDLEEKTAAKILIQNLQSILHQLKGFVETEEFKVLAKDSENGNKT